MEEIKELRERVRLLEEENDRLRGSNSDNCEEKNVGKSEGVVNSCAKNMHRASTNTSFEGSLNPEQIERYSRQLLLHGGFGVEGQLKLLNSSVLVVGAGGIGSTGKALDARSLFGPTLVSTVKFAISIFFFFIS
jgi:hypothetical protein